MSNRNFLLGTGGLNNTYVPGSGVGASSIANRRAKLLRSTSRTGTNSSTCSFSRLGLKNNWNGNNYAPPVTAPTTTPTPTIIKFITPGPSTWTAPAGTTSVRYLVVGGGGGGGGAYDNAGGGGGGGGLVLEGTMDVSAGETYNVIVGTGGAGATRPIYSFPAAELNNENGSPGQSSSFHDITAGGGGFGYKSRTGGGVVGLKANGSTPPTGGAGGGSFGLGGGGNSSDGTPTGQGGAGITSNISGRNITYGKGGASGFNLFHLTGTPGEVNTGNGGQGGGSPSLNNIGGADGGSGIVIISFYT
jgi:hypothetical protein